MEPMLYTRKVIYHVAITLDNFIAHSDESVDGFLTDSTSIPDYLNSLQHYDTVLMGRRTYEWGFRFGNVPDQPAPLYGHMQQYVFSRSMALSQHPQLHIIPTDPAATVRDLKSHAGGTIYLCGGGQLAGYLLQHALIDELILKLNPVAFGEGIALFGACKQPFGLGLLDTRTYADGVVVLHYTIQYGPT